MLSILFNFYLSNIILWISLDTIESIILGLYIHISYDFNKLYLCLCLS